MDFAVCARVTEEYPDLNIGIVIGRDVAARADTGPLVDAFVEHQVQALKRQFDSELRLAEHPFIQAWRETYRRFGVKPKRHKPTAEALCRRVVRDGAAPRISPLVDAYLAVELGTLLPFGGYDLDTLQGELRLDHSPGGEVFHALGEQAVEQTEPDEIVYRDSARVLTRRWNYRDAFDTRIRADSANIMLMVEGASPLIPGAAVADAADTLCREYARCFDGAFRVALVTAAAPHATL